VKQPPSIQSAQNSMVKHAYSLKVPKKLRESEDFLCEGYHLVWEALQGQMKCRFIFANDESLKHPEGRKILETAQEKKVSVFSVSSKIISYVSDTVTPQGILAVVRKPLPAWPEKPFGTVLAVHQVQDAGNMGTLLRSAEAFGARGVFVTEDSCDLFNPKTVRASMGSILRLPFQTRENWKAYQDWFSKNGFHIYALTLHADKSLIATKFASPAAIWVGAEGSGLPDELVASCHERVGIPMEGEVESLNVGIAASLALFWVNQRAPLP
jgi:RNA methyltransferase, TrmH family